MESKGTVRYNEDGEKQLNEYIIMKELGRGAFGKVFLVINENDRKKCVRDFLKRQ